MLVGEANADTALLHPHRPANFGLTILAADLIYTGNDNYHFQGNYDYDAHPQVYWGGADPLGSQGYESVARNPSSS